MNFKSIKRYAMTLSLALAFALSGCARKQVR